MLTVPHDGRAYRFVYPDLLVASEASATIWNIVTAQITQHFHLIAQEQLDGFSPTIGILRYVDLNKQYAFICSSYSFQIFDREHGQLVWSLAGGIQPPDFYSNERFQVTSKFNNAIWETNPVDLQLPIDASSSLAVQEDFFYAGKLKRSFGSKAHGIP